MEIAAHGLFLGTCVQSEAPAERTLIWMPISSSSERRRTRSLRKAVSRKPLSTILLAANVFCVRIGSSEYIVNISKMADTETPNVGHTQVPAEISAHEKGSDSMREAVKPESGLHKSEKEGASSRGWRFWAVFPPICLATLLIALESTVTTASLPKIAADLDAGDDYVWIMNGYLLTASVNIYVLDRVKTKD